MTALLTDYRDISALTGADIEGEDHLRQSLADILTTPLGSRVMRRDYGSRVAALLDAPMTPGLVADLVQATAVAIHRWEPRVTLKRVIVRAAEVGRLTLDLVLELRGRPILLERVV